MKDKIQEKLKKHYPIFVNGHKVPILSHKINFDNKNNILEIKTKIRSAESQFYFGEIIKIEFTCGDKNHIYNCKLIAKSSSPSIARFSLHIIDQKVTGKISL